MNRILMAAATTVLLATSAGAGQFAVSFPNLTFPSGDGVTVAKDCLASGVATGLCTTKN